MPILTGLRGGLSVARQVLRDCCERLRLHVAKLHQNRGSGDPAGLRLLALDPQDAKDAPLDPAGV